MAAPFAVTVSPESSSLRRGASGIAPAEFTYTVTQTGPRRLTGRAVLRTSGAEASDWLAVLGPSERDFEPNGTHTFQVRVTPPADAAPGRHTFRLNIYDVHRPDEGQVEGPEVAFEVPEPVAEGRPSLRRLLVPWLAAVVLLVTATAIGIALWPSGPGEVEVPPLVGLTEAEAGEEAERSELALEVDEEPIPSDDVPPGSIAEQDPDADELVERESVVRVWLATELVEAVPDVEGLDLDRAEERIRANGLVPTVAERRITGDRAAGQIVAQDPKPPTELAPGTEVSLVVEAESVAVPPLRDRRIEDARERLAERGLEVSERDVERSGQEGIVLDQSHEPDEPVAPGTTIQLDVSRRPAVDPEPEPEPDPFPDPDPDPGLPPIDVDPPVGCNPLVTPDCVPPVRP